MSDEPARGAVAEAGRLDFEGLSEAFGDVAALAEISLGVAAGEFVTILGPSGSGKTTLLKVIAGFETADAGRVRVDGSDVTDLDPALRNIGMVFQNYALFPHMSVARNVGYPLAMRGMRRGEIVKRVAAALEMVELDGMAERLPKQLSGGQQQRVALARATVFRPRLLLLDEPFGALDRKLREQMQMEVRRLQRRLGLTTLFITHDQEEALIMSDRVAVMGRGRLQQVGRPHEIYETPVNPFIADFIGESNILAGRVEASSDGVLRVRHESGATIQVASRAVCSRHDQTRAVRRPRRRRRSHDGQQNRRIGCRKRLHWRIRQVQDFHPRGIGAPRAAAERAEQPPLRFRPTHLCGLPRRRCAADRGRVTAMTTSLAASVQPVEAAQSRSHVALGSLALTLPALLLLCLLFVLPLARLFALSFDGGNLEWYEKVLTGGLYTTILLRTFEIAAIVTVCCLVIGYPVAFLLATTTPIWRAIGFSFVLLPLWTSVLVRTYAWMVLLGRNGIINRTLIDSA
jgi:putative spermidine/putrescine transport system ATP-binding protein